ncbi:MAG: oxygen-dependent coproporphyrinogen oxidase [Candidatus Margulisiibacteriota bacterium]
MVKISTQGKMVSELLKQRQDEICQHLNAVDGSSFVEDIWSRSGGGGGITRIIESEVYEKAGVNTSIVHGLMKDSEVDMFNQLIKRVSPIEELTTSSAFFATGVSLVIHPRNPHVPTVHANYRYFEVNLNNNESLWWFGGGADLTPYYLIDDDAKHFHSIHQKVCESYKKGSYVEFKSHCDRYFFLPHRQETRGIGGIFFDYLNDDFNLLFNFIGHASSAFIDAYLPIVNKRKGMTYSTDERHWQCIRRGRYAEFNLLYDRGTLFGLKTNGRIESILMSMPPEARWGYNIQPRPKSKEAHLQNILKSPRDWIKDV